MGSDMSESLLIRLLRAIAVITLFVGANQAVADDASAEQYFDIGNSAFRQGNYESALANYSDAMTEGKDDARLFYNMGLAHYRLDQYPQAKRAFEESSKDAGLAALSYYQLGVLARKSGNVSEAEDWFIRARSNAKSDKLRKQSSRALEVIGAGQPEFEFSASLGFGYDSNAFRTPKDPYLDLSRAVPVLVDPNVQSGAYLPAKVNFEYMNPVGHNSRFVTSYRYRGDIHLDSELSNADESSHRLKLGGEHLFGDGQSENRKIEYAAVYRKHDETNFDRDDGLDRFDNGESIADRYNYQGFGAEVGLRNYISSNRFELEGGWQQRDYDELLTASSYDMTTYWIGGAYKIPVSDNSRVKIGYEYYARDFDERRSRDANGDTSIINPTIKYDYHNYELGLKSRLSDRVVAELIYFYTVRSDDFVGYNDYTKHKFRLKTNLEINDRLLASIRLTYRDQDYENAFAFDNPTQAGKEYQELEVVAAAEFELNDRLSIRADLKTELVESSDPRGEYDRTRAAIGVVWQF